MLLGDLVAHQQQLPQISLYLFLRNHLMLLYFCEPDISIEFSSDLRGDNKVYIILNKFFSIT